MYCYSCFYWYNIIVKSSDFFCIGHLHAWFYNNIVDPQPVSMKFMYKYKDRGVPKLFFNVKDSLSNYTVVHIAQNYTKLNLYSMSDFWILNFCIGKILADFSDEECLKSYKGWHGKIRPMLGQCKLIVKMH